MTLKTCCNCIKTTNYWSQNAFIVKLAKQSAFGAVKLRKYSIHIFNTWTFVPEPEWIARHFRCWCAAPSASSTRRPRPVSGQRCLPFRYLPSVFLNLNITSLNWSMIIIIYGITDSIATYLLSTSIYWYVDIVRYLFEVGILVISKFSTLISLRWNHMQAHQISFSLIIDIVKDLFLISELFSKLVSFQF